MECPSCRQNLDSFDHLYRFCPLCSAPLPEGTEGPAPHADSVPERAIPRDMVRNPTEESPDRYERPLFDIYWKDEVYRAGKSNALEISLVPATDLKEISVKAKLLSLGLVIERETLPWARKSTALYFYFKPDTAGRHIGKVAVTCHDRAGNPTVFETEDFVFHVDEEEKEQEGHTTFNIGDIITTSQVSLGATRAVERPTPRDEDSVMVKLELTCNEAETERIRRLALVDRMMAEGRRFFDEGSEIIESSRRSPGRANQVMGEAIDLLSKAKDRFLHIRQEDPAHEESLRYMERVKDLMAGSGVRETGKGETARKRFTSCTLRIPGTDGGRRVLLISRETITIGRGETNDIAIPDLDHLSEKHALIKVSNRGEFFIRDTGTGGTGSKNGTFLNAGKSRIIPQKDYPLADGTIINLAKALGLFCRYLRGPVKEKGTPPGEPAATGEHSDTAFGIDKWGMIDAVKLQPGNRTMKDEYVVLLREITAGSGSANGLVLKGDLVSHIHLRILYRGGLYLIEDLNSAHGTFLGGFRLEPGTEYALTGDGVITVGDIEIGVEVRE